jgi:hypothetical protein
VRRGHMKRYNFYLSETQLVRLREIAEWEDRSMSELLRYALDVFIIERLTEKRRRIQEAIDVGSEDVEKPEMSRLGGGRF